MIESLAHPWVLVSLAFVPIVVAVASRRGRRGSLMYSATRRAAEARVGLRGRLSFLPTFLRVLALSALIVAIARPQRASGRSEESADAIALQLVVDRSGSMLEPAAFEGAETTRLEAVKKVVAEFVSGNGDYLPGREGDMLGLVAFASYADTVCPLVRGHEVLLERISQIEVPRLESERGTAIGEAIILGAARLKSAEESMQKAAAENGEDDFELQSKAIVLLTDGENTSGVAPLAAAQVAADWDVRVYIIGIRGGTTQPFGNTRIFLGRNEVNERELEQVAEMTGGDFWPVDKLDQLRDVYAAIDRLEKTRIEVNEFTEYEELFMPWALAGLALLSGELLLRFGLLRRLP